MKAAASAILLALVSAGFAPAVAAEAPTVETIRAQPDETLAQRLDAIDRRAAEIGGLRVTFKQRKFTPMLKKPIVSSGTLVVKGEHSRWDTDEPQASIMTIDNATLRLYYPREQVQEVYALGQDVRLYSGSPLPRIDALRKVFEIREAPEAIDADDPARDQKMALALTPLEDELKKRVERITVVIDESVPCAARITMELPDGDRTIIDFSEVRVDNSIELDDVTFDVPKGTRIVHPLGDAGEAEPER